MLRQDFSQRRPGRPIVSYRGIVAIQVKTPTPAPVFHAMVQGFTPCLACYLPLALQSLDNVVELFCCFDFRWAYETVQKQNEQ